MIGVDIFNLTGKTAFISGATGYLGQQMTEILAEAGATVLINSRDKKKCSDLAFKLTSRGLSVIEAPFDVTCKDSVDEFFKGYNNKINIIVNNAYSGGGGSLEYASEQDYLDSYKTTVIAANNIVMAALPLLKRGRIESGDASVINISSMYGVVSPDQDIYDSPRGCNPPFYGAAKAALIQWTRYAAVEFGRDGIRVNSITPGPFPSCEVQSKSPEFIKKLENKAPLRRIGESREIRGPVLFLASSASSFVSGSNLAVDGGWTSW